MSIDSARRRDTAMRRPTRAEIDLDQLSANYRAIEAAVGSAQMMPVLKANAYGHGLVEIGRHLESHHPAGLGVAFLEEAIELRLAGVTSPILVLGGLDNAQIPLFLEYDVMLTASSDFKLREIDRIAGEIGSRAKVHLKVDTGMGRIGMRPETAHVMFETGRRSHHVSVDGVFSHLATADEANKEPTRIQLDRFREALSYYDDADAPRPIAHIANSGGILQHPESHFDMVRPGILLFGVYPATETTRTIDVHPTLEFRSRVSFFKVQPATEPVGYGSTWAPDRDTRIVTVPAGYGDGYFRALGNRAEVIISNRRHPVVGRVCMDQFMVDIGPDGTAYNGDEVILMGSTNGVSITAEELADWAGTIPYEVLTNIAARVDRIYRGGSTP